MTISRPFNPSLRVHNIVEYIKNNGDFLCDADELEERGIQEILQEDIDIFETFKNEELRKYNSLGCGLGSNVIDYQFLKE